MTRFLSCLWICALLGAAGWRVHAHDGLNAQIIAVSRQLILEPRNAQLYLRRADLYRLQREWKNALNDYQQAETLGIPARDLAFERGRVWLASKRARQAQQAFTLWLQHQPTHAEAWRLRAQAAIRLHQDRQAVADYTNAIQLAPAPQPDTYLERAAVQIRLRQFSVALADIEAGLAQLGNIIPLQLKALELERRLGRWDAALMRLEALAKQVPRQETWLMRKGELLQVAGRHTEARAAYQSAWQALSELPPAQRNTKAMDQLAARLQTALRR